ncbi:hypothetical protein LQU92_09650 [Kocuria sp. LUK]|uniref:hypothetical protein n=1 Tax=Kocuria sp. LUK TaxID=2897828 RepID=UPI001E53D223|nr:hypothetical protein [Kocuria sp. LUK]MCD1145497.1 hypothetical protein [Kocuria sp. LUK]
MLETRSATQDHTAGKGRGAPVRAVPPRRPSAAPAVLLGLGAALAVVAVAAGQAWSELALDAAVVLLTVGGVGLLLDAALARRQAPPPAAAPPPPEPVPPAVREDRLGLAGVREELDTVDVLRGVRPGQELWWMDTFPLTLAGDLDAIHKALGAGVRIRLLLLDPRSPALASLLRDIRHRYGLSPMDLRRGFDTLSHQLRALGAMDPVVAERLEVRVYDGQPGAPVFVVLDDGAAGADDDAGREPELVRAYSSYYLLDASQDMPYLEWRPGAFAEKLRAFVAHKWSEAHTVFPTDTGERSASAFHLGERP